MASVCMPAFVFAASPCHVDNGLWTMVTVNPNGWKGTLKYSSPSIAEVMMVQETKLCRGDALGSAERAAETAGRSAATYPATITELGGVSAGVTVATKACIGVARNDIVFVPIELQSRIILCTRINAVCKGGIHCVSLYCFDSEGLSERSLNLVHYADQVVQSVCGPWIFAFDFNLTLEALTS